MKQLIYLVWDFEQGCWIEDSTGFDEWAIDPSGYIELWDNECHVPYTPGRFDILLWTGKQTKKGGEIYDGTIIKHNDITWTKGEDVIAVVFWDKEYGEFRLHHDGKHEWAFECPDGPTCVWWQFEIIGNKYDNPDLVSGKE